MSIKDWKTDIKIKFPRIHIIRPKDKTFVAGKIIEGYLGFAFWLSFLGWWKIYDLIEPYIK